MSMRPDGLGPRPVAPVGDPDGPKELYADKRTKEAFRDETDINAILRKAQRVGSISHLMKHGASYGDFSDVPDLLTAKARIDQGAAIFAEAPVEIRKEFENDMFKFFAFVNDPENSDHLREMLPALAEPGKVNPDVLRNIRTEPAPPDPVPEPSPEPPPEPQV